MSRMNVSPGQITKIELKNEKVLISNIEQLKPVKGFIVYITNQLDFGGRKRLKKGK